MEERFDIVLLLSILSKIHDRVLVLVLVLSITGSPLFFDAALHLFLVSPRIGWCWMLV